MNGGIATVITRRPPSTRRADPRPPRGCARRIERARLRSPDRHAGRPAPRGGSHGAVGSPADEVRPRRVRGSRAPGTTSPPTCPWRRSRRCIRAPRQPIGPADLAPLFPMALIGQEVCAEREIEIPGAGPRRVSPLPAEPAVPRPPARAALDTPAHIYYKYEGVSPAGSHKPNTAIAQAYYNKEEGIKRLATETGAGPVGQRAGVRRRAVRPRGQGLHGPRSYDQKPYRRILMETYGAEVVASPSAVDTTTAGAVLGRDPGQPGLARHRHQRGGRGCRDPRRHEVRARLRAQPRPAPPDGHRPGGDRADGHGRRVARRRHRLRRRRLELRRA